jgi:hypothetical protein
MYESNYLHVENIDNTIIESTTSHTERLFKILVNNLFLEGIIKKTNKYVSFDDIVVTGSQLNVYKVCKEELDRLFQERLGYSEGIRNYFVFIENRHYGDCVQKISFKKKI